MNEKRLPGFVLRFNSPRVLQISQEKNCLIFLIRLHRLIWGCYGLLVSSYFMNKQGGSGRDDPASAISTDDRIAHCNGNPEPSSSPQPEGTGDYEIDRIVVRRVYDRCHPFIVKAVSATALPAEFLAALAANESGGNPKAACFEPEVYKRLKAVASGEAPSFGCITGKNIFAQASGSPGPGGHRVDEPLSCLDQRPEAVQVLTALEEDELRELATSWGFTQIMGYQAIARKSMARNLLDPQFHFQIAVEILIDFARRFRLRLSQDFEALFRCWNTGHPDGRTFDPDYVAKGMRRMKLYRELMEPAERRPSSRKM